MRTISEHQVNHLTANDNTSIAVLDEPGQGGACHEYKVSYSDKDYIQRNHLISFQNGPIKEFGINGLTHEVLLAIIIDRLKSFQAGPFKCQDNAAALIRCQEALLWLQKRTRERLVRGVEGTHKI